jgi:DNA-binding MarR family transcriptional regulator
MIDQTLSTLAVLANAVFRGLMLPGDFLLSAFAWIAPQSAEMLTNGTGKAVVMFVLTLVGWTIIVVIGLLISRVCRGLARQFGSMFRILLWNAKMFMGNLKTKMLWKYREYFAHKTTQTETVSQEQFDDMDIAVLASLSRKGSGKASSAPELAEKYKLRPAQVQDRLDRLAMNHLLHSVIGSTDGYDKYRLTESGLALLAMCERQASARANLRTSV